MSNDYETPAGHLAKVHAATAPVEYANGDPERIDKEAAALQAANKRGQHTQSQQSTNQRGGGNT